jgi:hypothetical protein
MGLAWRGGSRRAVLAGKGRGRVKGRCGGMVLGGMVLGGMALGGMVLLVWQRWSLNEMWWE